MKLDFSMRVTIEHRYFASNGVRICPYKGRPSPTGGMLDLENFWLAVTYLQF